MSSESKQKISIAGAFEKHFMHFGFKKTAVDDVVAEMGISKKTIYKYFRSKEEIFYFIINRKAKARRVMIEKELEHISSAGAKMETMIRINLAGFRKIHNKKGHTLMDSFQYEIASGAFREAFYVLVREIIEEGVRNDEFSVSDNKITIRYVQTLISETIRIIVEDSNSHPEEQLICAIHRLLDKTK